MNKTQLVEETREIARGVFEQHYGSMLPRSTPLNTLFSLNWEDLCDGDFGQGDMARMNLGLDPRSCLGRSALAVTIIERFFPEAEVKCAEVAQDMFRELLLQQWGKIYNTRNWPPDSWLEELLMYEEPHSIVMVDGKQFDPLFCVYAQRANCSVENLFHPGVIEFPAWEEIAAARMVSEAWLEPNPETKLEVLRAANEICPRTIIVRQNIVQPLLSTGRDEDFLEAWKITRALCDESPNVRGLMVLEDVFGEVGSRKNEYTRDLWAMLVSCVRRSS